MPDILENADEKLSTRMRRLLDFLWQEWKGLQSQIDSLNADLEEIASSDASCLRLQQIPGVGPLVATAVVSAIGNGGALKEGREFAAWLGLVPRQWSNCWALVNGGTHICAECSSTEPELPSCASNAKNPFSGTGSVNWKPGLLAMS